MYDVILVPTDGSEHAARAAEHAALLADAFDAAVHVVSVVDDGSEERRDAAREAVDAVESLVADGARVETAILDGVPEDAILAYADDHGADLVAMGTHGRTGVDRYVAGSVTEAVVRHADAPVLAVRATEESRPRSYEDVLVPTDGTPTADAAVDHGVAIADAFDATVHVVNVVDTGGTHASPTYELTREMVAELEAAGQRVVEDVAERARDAGVNATTYVHEGHAAEGILDYVDDHGVDLTVMGTRGESGLTRFLLGSTAERVIRHSPVPVVAVNARGDRE
ncbi:universal stress protein [Halobacterium yunchengense]|uniref:universal stress protein n=1 Tax=Halobacterium yunchengense TaxID=3108497 RepID=UPI00300BEE28